VLSGSLPEGVGDDIYAKLAKQMPEECRVVVDTKGDVLARSLETPVYLIKPNVRELGQLVGRDIESDEEIVEVSRRLISDGKVQVVVTSLGSGGAMLVTADHTEQLRSPTVKIRSKVGAGDSMVAGIVLGLARGWSVRDAVRLGIAAGAAAVMTEGTELCRRADVERLYEHMVESSPQDTHEQTV
jgi:6-phosphofructokinase 2